MGSLLEQKQYQAENLTTENTEDTKIFKVINCFYFCFLRVLCALRGS